MEFQMTDKHARFYMLFLGFLIFSLLNLLFILLELMLHRLWVGAPKKNYDIILILFIP